MSSSTSFLLAGLLFAVALAMLAGMLAGQRLGRYAAQKIMTNNETDFFKRLTSANPNGYVFPQVALAALIAPTVRSPKARLIAFRRISQKRVDYAIYTNRLELICVVELDGRTHEASRDAIRDAFLASAGITTVRWESTIKPGVEAIRDQFEQLRPADAFFSYRAADGKTW